MALYDATVALVEQVHTNCLFEGVVRQVGEGETWTLVDEHSEGPTQDEKEVATAQRYARAGGCVDDSSDDEQAVQTVSSDEPRTATEWASTAVDTSSVMQGLEVSVPRQECVPETIESEMDILIKQTTALALVSRKGELQADYIAAAAEKGRTDALCQDVWTEMCEAHADLNHAVARHQQLTDSGEFGHDACERRRLKRLELRESRKAHQAKW